MPKDQLPVQALSFELIAKAPDISKCLNTFEMFDTSAIMLEASYRNEPFWRVSYLMIHQDRENQNADNIPQTIDLVFWQSLRRFINNQAVVSTEEICWDEAYDKEIALLQQTTNQNDLNNINQMNSNMINNWGNIFENNENSMFNPTNMNNAFEKGAQMDFSCANTNMSMQNNQPGMVIQDPHREDLSRFRTNYFQQTFAEFRWE